MSRSNVSDVQFVAAIGARGALIGLMVVAIISLVRRMWDAIEFELGGLPNFQARR